LAIRASLDPGEKEAEEKGEIGMPVLSYEGTVRGFRQALREIRKAAMRGDKLADPVARRRLQARIAAIQALDQARGGEVA
jgi:hypothetical protein